MQSVANVLLVTIYMSYRMTCDKINEFINKFIKNNV